MSTFKELTTITGKVIRVRPNKYKKTFTISVNGSKYRTINMGEEFEQARRNWTGNDWQDFLKTDEYYKI